MEEPSNQAWYWSQSGITLGPIDLEQLRLLAASGSLGADNWVYDPTQRSWVLARSIAGLFATNFPPGPAPDARPEAPPSVVYCRSCGASNSPFATRCASCGRDASVHSHGIDPKLAFICCRISILATPLLAATVVGPVVAPAIIWAIGARNEVVVAEAKGAFNCLLTLLIAFVGAWVFGLVGAILIVPTILAAIFTGALVVYCIVAGILGLVAIEDGKPFRYPMSLTLIR